MSSEADAVEEQQNRERTVPKGQVVRIMENSSVNIMADNTVSPLGRVRAVDKVVVSVCCALNTGGCYNQWSVVEPRVDIVSE